MRELPRLLALLGVNSEDTEPTGPSLGEFTRKDWRRRDLAEINQRALYEARSLLRQQFEPLPAPPPQLPAGLSAPSQVPGQRMRGGGMFGAVGLPTARAQALPQRAETQEEPSLPVDVRPMPRRGLEPATAPVAMTQADIENDAWNAALARVQTHRRPDPTGLRRIARRELSQMGRAPDLISRESGDGRRRPPL